MKQFYKAFAVAALGVATLSAWAQPSANFEPCVLPDGVSVTPPQGLINILGPNAGNDLGAYVKGCQQIGVKFGPKLATNFDCQGKVAIYKNGKETPEEEIAVSECVSYDSMDHVTGSIMFKRKYTTTGLYRIVIPEGAWILNPVIDFWTDEASVGPDSSLSPAVEIAYEIFKSYRIFPQPGVVTNLDEFTLVFPGAEEVTVNTSKLRGVVGDYDVTYASTVSGETVTLKSSISVTTPGEYSFSADPKAFVVKYPGGVEYSSEKIYERYIIDSRPRPLLEPAEGSEVGGFSNILLSVNPSNKTLWPNDHSVGGNGIYRVDEFGVIDENPICLTEPVKVNNYQINYVVTDLEGNRLLEPFVPEDGEYVFVPNDWSFEDDLGTNPWGYNFRFTVKNGTAGPTIDPVVTTASTLYELSPLGHGDKYKYEGTVKVSHWQDGYAFVQDENNGVLLSGIETPCERGAVINGFEGTCLTEDGVRTFAVEGERLTIGATDELNPTVLPDYTSIPNFVNMLVTVKGASVRNSAMGGKELSMPYYDIEDEEAEDVVQISTRFGCSVSHLANGYHPSIEGIFGIENGGYVFYVIDKQLTSIEEIETEKAPAEYYTLDGLRLNKAPQSGLYLERRGVKVTKKLAK